jgi:hypothetical protein
MRISSLVQNRDVWLDKRSKRSKLQMSYGMRHMPQIVQSTTALYVTFYLTKLASHKQLRAKAKHVNAIMSKRSE